MNATEEVGPVGVAKGVNLLMRSKGWPRSLCLSYCGTLLVNELMALIRLEDEPVVLETDVNAIIDAVEVRQSAEETRKQEEQAAPQEQITGDDPLPSDETTAQEIPATL